MTCDDNVAKLLLKSLESFEGGVDAEIVVGETEQAKEVSKQPAVQAAAASSSAAAPDPAPAASEQSVTTIDTIDNCISAYGFKRQEERDLPPAVQAWIKDRFYEKVSPENGTAIPPNKEVEIRYEERSQITFAEWVEGDKVPKLSKFSALVTGESTSSKYVTTIQWRSFEKKYFNDSSIAIQIYLKI